MTGTQQDSMTMKEKISELLDDELNDLEHYRLMQALEDNRELRGVWDRYHLMRAAMRKELDIMVSPGLADRVGESIRADQPYRGHPAGRTAGFPRYARAAAGLAIAASVALVAIFTLQPQSLPGVPASPLAALKSPAPVAAGDAANFLKPPAARQSTLNTYLVEHSEFTPNAGMNGMMSYVRIVGYGNSKAQNSDK
jgi:sigma-E factor negative regulatory protein RseA